MARQGLFLKKECTCKYTIDLKIMLNAVIRNKLTLNSEIDDLLELVENKQEFAKRRMERKEKYDANTYQVKFVSVNDVKLSDTRLATILSFNLGKHYIFDKVSPIIKNATNFSKANIAVGSALIASEARLAIQAMSSSSKLLMGKAFLGGTQGVFGAWSAGGDKVDILSGGVLGGFFSSLNLPGHIPLRLSSTTESIIGAAIGNLAGQVISIQRNSEKNHLNTASLLFSTWGGGLTGYITKDITIGTTKAVIESTIQNPIDIIGSHLGE